MITEIRYIFCFCIHHCCIWQYFFQNFSNSFCSLTGLHKLSGNKSCFLFIWKWISICKPLKFFIINQFLMMKLSPKWNLFVINAFLQRIFITLMRIFLFFNQNHIIFQIIIFHKMSWINMINIIQIIIE